MVHEGGGSAINKVKRFQNSMDLEISVGNCYTENRLMHTFYDNFYQGGHYSDQIASHQEYLRTEETSLIKMFIHI